jgi:hypothetical protein
VSTKQRRELKPGMKKLFPIIAMSTWGEVPDDFDFRYRPIRTLSAEQMAELADKKSKSIVEVYNSGLISQKIGMKELRQLEDETGLFSNITDEDIEAADNTLTPQDELAGSMLGFGGKPGAKGKPGGKEADLEPIA